MMKLQAKAFLAHFPYVIYEVPRHSGFHNGTADDYIRAFKKLPLRVQLLPRTVGTQRLPAFPLSPRRMLARAYSRYTVLRLSSSHIHNDSE